MSITLDGQRAVIITCDQCGSLTRVTEDRANDDTPIYCSATCQEVSEKDQRYCMTCREPLPRERPSGALGWYCSQSCYDAWKKKRVLRGLPAILADDWG